MDAVQPGPECLDSPLRATEARSAADLPANSCADGACVEDQEPDGAVRLQAGGQFTRLLFFDVSRGTQPLPRVAWSPDGTVVAVVQDDHVRVLSTPEDLRHHAADLADLRGHLVAFGPEGQPVAIEAKSWSGSSVPSATACPASEVPHDLVHYAVARVCTDISAGRGSLPGDYWRRLPTYAVRPYSSQKCCLGTLDVFALWDADEPMRHTLAHELAHALTSATTGFVVTFSDRQYLQDYKAGLLRLVDFMLASTLRMLVILLAALAHQAAQPPFLLVILSSIRHYGHRGEPDHLAIPAPALISDRQRGAVRLAA